MRNPISPRSALIPLFIVTLTAAALFVSPASSGQKRASAREDVSRVLREFDELSLEPSALLNGVRKTGRLSLRTSRGDFDIRLEPFDVRGANYRSVAVLADGSTAELGRAPARWFRGTVEGLDDSHARFVLDEGEFEGVIVTPAETFYVEPARDFSDKAAGGEFVFYAASSVKPSAEGGECGTTLAERVGAEAARQSSNLQSANVQTSFAADGHIKPAVFGPKPETEIATDADFEFTQLSNGDAADTNNDILNTLAQVDGIYDAQLGVRLRVVFQRAWTANNDPYTSNVAGPALDEFRRNYDASFGGPSVPARDLTHLFTGKSFVKSDTDPTPSNIIGIAYTGVTCSAPDFAYGISRGKFSPNIVQRVALTAHEMGHNFGAAHPDQLNPVPPSCVPPAVLDGNIMNSFIQTTSTFCQFSRDQITRHVVSEGSCLSRLVPTGCTYTVTPSEQNFTPQGGTGAITITTNDGCPWGLAEGADWVDGNVPSSSGTGAVFYSVQPNTAAGSGPRETPMEIGGRTVTVRQTASPLCPSSPIGFGQNLAGSLDSADCVSGQNERAGAFLDQYTFAARAGQRVKVEMNATAGLDTFLYLFGPDGSLIAFNDDIVAASQTDSRIPLDGTLALPSTGIYTIEATSFSRNASGGYTLALTDNAAANSVSFETGALSVSESPGAGGVGSDGSGFRVVNVTRAGDATGTATVDYSTADGMAEQRKDYEQAVGTLVFGPGETTKSFMVFVNDDALAEEPETLTLRLSNPVGTTLGATSSATLIINSGDAASASSPVRAESFDTAFFVRQNYLDFLNREPDAPGFAFWQNEINQCGTGTEAAQCREVKRINVSAAFFQSIEFQNTGYLVYRTYKVAYGDATSPGVEGTVPVVRLNEFIPDTQRIGQGLIVGQGNWQQQLEANKRAFMLEFVLRGRFLAAYPLSMTPAQFVDKLFQNAGVGATQAERDQLAAQLTAAADTAAARAAVLRQVAEDARLQQQERNRAFVLMQYYGYLRRNPDDSPEAGLNFAGWKFWLTKLEQFNGNFVSAEMVKAFLTSDEYVKRFGL